MTKCLETQRACQESMCVMLGRTQVAFFHKENSRFGYGKACLILSRGTSLTVSPSFTVWLISILVVLRLLRNCSQLL